MTMTSILLVINCILLIFYYWKNNQLWNKNIKLRNEIIELYRKNIKLRNENIELCRKHIKEMSECVEALKDTREFMEIINNSETREEIIQKITQILKKR